MTGTTEMSVLEEALLQFIFHFFAITNAIVNELIAIRIIFPCLVN